MANQDRGNQGTGQGKQGGADRERGSNPGNVPNQGDRSKRVGRDGGQQGDREKKGNNPGSKRSGKGGEKKQGSGSQK